MGTFGKFWPHCGNWLKEFAFFSWENEKLIRLPICSRFYLRILALKKAPCLHKMCGQFFSIYTIWGKGCVVALLGQRKSKVVLLC